MARAPAVTARVVAAAATGTKAASGSPSAAAAAAPPAPAPARGLAAQLAWLAQQLLPEPAPAPPTVHPSKYYAVENVRHYSDGMHKLYTPNLFTRAFAALTLGLYIGVPYVLMGLFVAAFFRRWALWTLLGLLGTLLLPARPLRIQAVLSSYLFLCWRRYFSFSYLFEKSLDCYEDYVIAQFPHGAFPLGALVGGSFMATSYPGYDCYALAASSAFFVPVWRHVHAWLGTEVCTKTNFHRLLSLGVRGAVHHRSSSGGGALAPQQQQQQQQQPQQQPGSGGEAGASAAGSLTQRRGSGLAPALSTQRSSFSGLRVSFKRVRDGGHTLSDTESSDSDAETCSACGARVSSGSGSDSEAADGSSSSSSSRCGCESARLVRGGSGTRRQQPAAAAAAAPHHHHQRLSDVAAAAATCAAASAADVPVPAHLTPEQAAAYRAAELDARAAAPAAPIDPRTGRRRTGVSVGLMVGGIAEMFMIRPDHERIKLKDRKGFVRIALEHGTDILPVFMFGANQLLDFGPPWLQRFSRRLRASLGVMYGAWGLPVPRRLPIFMVTGKPLRVGPALRKDHPDFARRVDELHAAFCGEMERLYYAHRAKYGHGYEHRPLVIC